MNAFPIHFLVPKWCVGKKFLDMPTYYLKKENLLSFIHFCRDHCALQFKYLIDCTAVDYPEEPLRFLVIYHLRSILYKRIIRIKLFLDEWTSIPSLVSFFSAANWYERELWDMFGIFVENHPDLRRLLTDYGFEGYPLRKDFPLSGYLEVFFDDGEKRVESHGIHMDQEYRVFDFTKPWGNESFQ